MDVCTVCLTPQETHPIDCPHAQLICTTCYTCGHRSKVVRPDNQVSDMGRRITLAVNSKEDLNRQLVKADSCTVFVPELELELTRGTLGVRFTTVEGLLQLVLADLQQNTVNIESENKQSALAEFLNRLQKAINLEETFTIILDDPLANSYVQPLNSNEQLVNEDYIRSEHMERELGIYSESPEH